MYRVISALFAITMSTPVTHAACVETSSIETDDSSAAASSAPAARGTAANQQAAAEIAGILDKLREFEQTFDAAVYDTYYPDQPYVIINGKISRPRKTDTLLAVRQDRQQREQHLNDYRVIDLKQPFISISADGSMAWTVIQQRKQEIDRRNGATLRSRDYSELMVFEKSGDGVWQLLARSRTGEN